MGHIYIESHPAVAPFSPRDHMYLVYEDDQGTEFVINGRASTLIPPFGHIIIEATREDGTYLPLADSSDARDGETPADRGQREIDLGGRNAEDVWAIMVQHAQNVETALLDYDLFSQNSNSTAASILYAVDIDVEEYLPLNTTLGDVSGVGNLLDFSTHLTGTGQDDRIRGGAGEDVLEGRDGADTIYGDGGEDQLFGGNGWDTIRGGTEGDYIEGNAGVDELFGEGGDDILIGGTEDDDLYGGADGETDSGEGSIGGQVQEKDKVGRAGG